MGVKFQCSACHTVHSVAEHLVGRRVSCPQCYEMVEVVPLSEPAAPGSAPTASDEPPAADDARGTVALTPTSRLAGETVMLEAVDVVSAAEALQHRSGGPPARPPAPKTTVDEPPPEAPLRKSRLADTEMDMTPMVDVTFQLLIFFMITAAFALQKAKEIPKPKQDDPSTNVVQQDPEEAADLVTVRVDEFNTFIVINPDGDEEEAPSVQDLYIKLKRAKTGGSSGKIPTKLRVEAHGDALHEKVVAALDAGNDTGFAELELTSAREDE